MIPCSKIVEHLVQEDFLRLSSGDLILVRPFFGKSWIEAQVLLRYSEGDIEKVSIEIVDPHYIARSPKASRRHEYSLSECCYLAYPPC